MPLSDFNFINVLTNAIAFPNPGNRATLQQLPNEIQTHLNTNVKTLVNSIEAAYGKLVSTVGGTAAAMTGTITPTPASYAAIIGVPIYFSPLVDSAAAGFTLNLNNLGAQNVVGGGLKAGQYYVLMYNGTAFTIIAGNPLRTYVHAYPQAATTTAFTTGAWTKIKMDSEVTDHLAEYDPATSKLTFRNAGIYLVECAILITGLAASQFEMMAYVNGVSNTYMSNIPLPAGNLGLKGHAILPVSANDYLEIYGKLNNNATTDAGSGSGTQYLRVTHLAYK